jgi:DNA mismatch endonuclease (patch repair protein)
MGTVRSNAMISAYMRRVHARDTTVELKLRKALWRTGLRYRLHAQELPGVPDVVFPSARVVLFIDGDFWHGNQWRLRGLSSLDEQFIGSANRDYWIRKITRNAERDMENDAKLAAMGWRVVRVWESDVKKDIDACVRRIAENVRSSSAKDIR